MREERAGSDPTSLPQPAGSTELTNDSDNAGMPSCVGRAGNIVWFGQFAVFRAGPVGGG